MIPNPSRCAAFSAAICASLGNPSSHSISDRIENVAAGLIRPRCFSSAFFLRSSRCSFPIRAQKTSAARAPDKGRSVRIVASSASILLLPFIRNSSYFCLVSALAASNTLWTASSFTTFPSSTASTKPPQFIQFRNSTLITLFYKQSPRPALMHFTQADFNVRIWRDFHKLSVLIKHLPKVYFEPATTRSEAGRAIQVAPQILLTIVWQRIRLWALLRLLCSFPCREFCLLYPIHGCPVFPQITVQNACLQVGPYRVHSVLV